MRRRGFIAGLLSAVALAFSATLSAQTSSVEGNVTGTDGRPLKDAEIRFEQKRGQVSPVVSHTDINGHCTAALREASIK
jgi:hypothetical protein